MGVFLEHCTLAECSAVGDADMDSQLSNPPDSQVTVAMDEGDCNGGGELEFHVGDSEVVTEQPLVQQVKEEEPDAGLSSVKAEPDDIQTGPSDVPVDRLPQEGSAVTEKQQIPSEGIHVAEESMASQSSCSGEENSDSEQPQPKPTFPTTLMEFGYQFNEGASN